MSHSYTTDGLGPLALWGEQEVVGHILPFWEQYGRDPQWPGFYGELDNQRRGNPRLPRSVVMTARHLWTYSAASRLFPENRDRYLAMAHYAAKVLISQYWDPKEGGVFWTVHPGGKPDITKKQLYGQAFALYGLSEYVMALLETGARKDPSLIDLTSEASEKTGLDSSKPLQAEYSPESQGEIEVSGLLQLTHSLFTLMETYGRDPAYDGYWEARAQDWSGTDDMRLSPRDMNCEKSMNTNLHVLEAYTTYYRLLQKLQASLLGRNNNQGVFHSSELHKPLGETSPAVHEVAKSLQSLLEVTVQHILGKDGHLMLYFNTPWQPLGDSIISYGHDIEASWLLWEAAETLAKGGDLSTTAVNRYRDTALKIAAVSLQEGFDCPEKKHSPLRESLKGSSARAPYGALDNELHGTHRDHTRIWWCQAEALVGYVNAYQLSGEPAFLDGAYHIKNWIAQFQIDPSDGEWFWAVSREGIPDLSQPKGGNWKASYHNGRCCMELIRRANFLPFSHNK
ncbi:MAG: AGE family epimerase/isomerase [Treponemataceae bacterium]|nr:AGE family epimerase/isomerase [Treponemataceae bacterium]